MAVGQLLGSALGEIDGAEVGARLGDDVGRMEGNTLGALEGNTLGSAKEGDILGSVKEGRMEGSTDGLVDGFVKGKGDGLGIISQSGLHIVGQLCRKKSSSQTERSDAKNEQLEDRSVQPVGANVGVKVPKLNVPHEETSEEPSGPKITTEVEARDSNSTSPVE